MPEATAVCSRYDQSVVKHVSICARTSSGSAWHKGWVNMGWTRNAIASAIRIMGVGASDFLIWLISPRMRSALLRSPFGPALIRLRGRLSPYNADPCPASHIIAVERIPGAIADLSAEEIRSTVAELNEQAERVGCVIFEGRSEQPGVVVIFAGHTERFFMLPIARHLTCRVIYLQDLQSGWFQGSDVLPDLPLLRSNLLAQEIGDRPCLFFGQSSGGYAALVASLGYAKSTVLACAPQSFSDGEVKRQIGFVGIRCLSTPAGLVDLQKALQGHNYSEVLRAVVIAASEADNPYTAHYWMDYLHALRLVGAPSVTLSIVRSNTHVIVHGRLNRFAVLLGELQAVMTDPPEERMKVLTRFLEAEFT